MAGLVPAIPIRDAPLYAPILSLHSCKPGGAIYVGVTNNLMRRVHEHKNGMVAGHTKQYGIKRLVYFEVYSAARDAIQREKNIKHWPRAWKTRLIATTNESWRDLYDEITGVAPSLNNKD